MRDHREVMCDLARERGWQRGIELGLGGGMLFARLLAQGVRMVGVDLGLRPDRREKVETLRTDPELGKLIDALYWLPTNEAARIVPDGWADFIFIDAGHSYEACRDDIIAWTPKLKPGGWLGGHDYHEAFPGVIRAVHHVIGEGNFELLDGHIWARLPQ